MLVLSSAEDNDVNTCNGSNEWRCRKLLLFNFFVMQIQFGNKKLGEMGGKPADWMQILILAGDRPVVSRSGLIVELNDPETQLLR